MVKIKKASITVSKQKRKVKRAVKVTPPPVIVVEVHDPTVVERFMAWLDRITR
jgi:hypothetical protein